MAVSLTSAKLKPFCVFDLGLRLLPCYERFFSHDFVLRLLPARIISLYGHKYTVFQKPYAKSVRFGTLPMVRKTLFFWRFKFSGWESTADSQAEQA
jgi:hypothetical protein